jgi:putative phosphonate metabolism protein
MRYAIYYTAPKDSLLTRLGATWLGRDAVTGSSLLQPEVPGLAAGSLAALTTDPRRYGFHGTLKAPFALREGQDELGLRQMFLAFCGHAAPFTIPGLAVTRLGRFLALTPQPASAELNAFAAACVEAFEPFRAPLGEAGMARRLASNLSARQHELLLQWGYPYVFEEFRFHMTLSVKLEEDETISALEAAATRHFASVTNRPHQIASLGLFAEPEPGAPFRALEILPLTGATAPQDSTLRQIPVSAESPSQ